jgi:hypothetical protein
MTASPSRIRLATESRADRALRAQWEGAPRYSRARVPAESRAVAGVIMTALAVAIAAAAGGAVAGVIYARFADIAATLAAVL